MIEHLRGDIPRIPDNSAIDNLEEMKKALGRALIQ
jgi:hypothetical protein